LQKRTKEIVDDKGRSEWVALICEWVHNEQDRKMLERHLLDGIPLEPLAEEFNLSAVQTQKRVQKAKEQLFRHI
jgi:Zn-finger protein